MRDTRGGVNMLPRPVPTMRPFPAHRTLQRTVRPSLLCVAVSYCVLQRHAWSDVWVNIRLCRVKRRKRVLQKACVNNEVASTQTSRGTAFPLWRSSSSVLSHSPGRSLPRSIVCFAYLLSANPGSDRSNVRGVTIKRGSLLDIALPHRRSAAQTCTSHQSVHRIEP